MAAHQHSLLYNSAGAAAPASFVTLCEGGTRFVCGRDTLLREPASRLALVARGVLPAQRDEAGVIFIDRDPRHFRAIANYLRDGWTALPATAPERNELLQEVRFFQLTGMEAWMHTQELAAAASEATSALLLQARPSLSSQGAACAAAPASSAASFARPSLFTSPRAPSTPPAAGGLLYAASQFAGSPACASTQAGLGSSPFRTSFLAGGNRDLLAAGALASAGISGATLLARYSTAATALPATTTASPFAVSYSAGVDGSGGVFSAGLPGYTSPLSEGFMAASKSVPAPLSGGAGLADGGWTHSLLKSNPRMQGVIATLLELATLPPHASLRGDRVTIDIASECQHAGGGADGRPSSLALLEAARSGYRNQAIRVTGTGWAFECAVPASDAALQEKFGGLAEFLTDNWFVVTAVLKEQHGWIAAQEDGSASRPTCFACRRHAVVLTLQRR